MAWYNDVRRTLAVSRSKGYPIHHSELDSGYGCDSADVKLKITLFYVWGMPILKDGPASSGEKFRSEALGSEVRQIAVSAVMSIAWTVAMACWQAYPKAAWSKRRRAVGKNRFSSLD